jgi:hypothetical protein
MQSRSRSVRVANASVISTLHAGCHFYIAPTEASHANHRAEEVDFGRASFSQSQTHRLEHDFLWGDIRGVGNRSK